MADYLALNKASWDDRAPAHAASPGYAVERFLADPSYLSEVVRFGLPRLGDVAGLRAAHLQCHIGTDTISLARLGASMTGLDFSPASLAQARLLAGRTGADARFVESDVYDAPAETDVVLTQTTTHQWNHGLGEIVAALMDAGLTVTGLAEHDSAPWNALPGLMAAESRGEWRLADRPWRPPCTFTLQAVRPGG